MSEFDAFLLKLLKRAKLKDTISNDIISNPKYHMLLEQAFTHYSYNPRVNYEKVETIGDVTLNLAIVNYIVKKYPSIKSSGEITNIKKKLISADYFAMFAKEMGFFKHIKIGDGDDYKNILYSRINNVKYFDFLFKINEADIETNIIIKVDEYRKLLTDAFESFCGTLQTIIDDRSGVDVGPGYAVCYAFITSFLDEIHISPKFEDNLDPIEYLKRIYDANDWPRNWPTNDKKTFNIAEKQKTIIDEFGNEIILKWYETTYFTYINKGRILLGTGVALTKKLSQHNSASESTKILREKYGISNINKKR